MTSTATRPLALVTGSARRIGADISRLLHANGYDLALHYRESEKDAGLLCAELNELRYDSAFTLRADLRNIDEVEKLFEKLAVRHDGLQVLVNNASAFYPTEFSATTVEEWDDLIDTNLKAPFFLSQHAAKFLQANGGSIVNIVDIIADKPRAGYTPYSASKSGLLAMTRSLARELAPGIRVNGVSPGAILWPEDAAEQSEEARQKILSATPLGRIGEPADIAHAVLFLARDAEYVTGQVISVDGGSSLTRS